MFHALNLSKKSEGTVESHHLEIQVGGGGCQMGFRGGVKFNGSKVILKSVFRLANKRWCERDQVIKGGIIHELMHVLGMAHNQVSHDRYRHPDEDNFYDDVDEKCVFLDRYVDQYEPFSKEDLNIVGIPYKCKSIMHWNKNTPCYGRTTPINSVCKLIGGKYPQPEDWSMLHKALCQRK